MAQLASRAARWLSRSSSGTNAGCVSPLISTATARELMTEHAQLKRSHVGGAPSAEFAPKCGAIRSASAVRAAASCC
eukprot:5302496-Prymnesium_polylepis.2